MLYVTVFSAPCVNENGEPHTEVFYCEFENEKDYVKYDAWDYAFRELQEEVGTYLPKGDHVVDALDGLSSHDSVEAMLVFMRAIIPTPLVDPFRVELPKAWFDFKRKRKAARVKTAMFS